MMGKHHRNRRRATRPAPVQSQAPAQASSGWDFRSGYSAPSRILDGSKFRGSLIYPAATDLDYSALRLRSRLAAFESTQARSLFSRLTDNAIGLGLTLQCSPIWELLDHPRLTTPDLREAYARKIELQFSLWANSPEASADGRLSLVEMEPFVFWSILRDGESAHVLRYNDHRDRLSPLSIQHLDPEQIVTPLGKIAETDAKIRGNRIRDGIEVDASGAMVAIHIHNPDANTYTRITTYGGAGAGRRWLLHPIITELVGAVRGTPILAPLIHELQKLTDYEVAEIEAAVVNAVIAGFVTTDVDGEKRNPLTGLGIQQAGDTVSSGTSGATSEGPKRSAIDAGGIWLQNLGKGQDLKSFDTKRPNVNFEAFVSAVERGIGASLGVGREVLNLLFSNNYSASRATLILFWKTVLKWRQFFAMQFLRPVYEAWMGEEIRLGRLAEIGTDWQDPIKRAAWLNASWDGDSLPSIDPLKDAQADDLRIAQGATTREAVARKYNGSDYRTNVQRLKEENSLLSEAGGKADEAARAAAVPPVPDDTPPAGGEE